MQQDEEQEREKQQSAAEEVETDLDSEVPPMPGGDFSPAMTPALLRQIFNSDFAKKDPTLKQLLKKNPALMRFVMHEREISEATEALRASEEEFEAFMKDEEAFDNRISDLFEGEEFAHLRFTAEEVKQAFGHFGFTPGSPSEMKDQMVQVIKWLGAKERRTDMAMELLLMLPQMVKEGRFMDAHMVNLTADALPEASNDLSPFLTTMVVHGLLAWQEESSDEVKGLLRKMGVSDLNSITPDDLDAMQEKLKGDAQTTAELENFMKAHPAFGGHIQSDEMYRESTALLVREDAGHLLLSAEELEPHLALISETLERMTDRFGEPGGAKLPPEQQQEAFEHFLLPTLRQIVEAVFTPERLRDFVIALRAYRNELFAHDKKTAIVVSYVISYVENETEPGANSFLVNLCYQSLLAVNEQVNEQDTEEP